MQSEMQPYTIFGYMNARLWELFAREWIVEGWDHFREHHLTPDERKKARLVWTFDHHPGHVRFLGGAKMGTRLLRHDIAMVLTGKEVTK